LYGILPTSMSWCDPSVAKLRQEDMRKSPVFLAHCQVVVFLCALAPLSEVFRVDP
jgi:hypothetical protein